MDAETEASIRASQRSSGRNRRASVDVPPPEHSARVSRPSTPKKMDAEASTATTTDADEPPPPMLSRTISRLPMEEVEKDGDRISASVPAAVEAPAEAKQPSPPAPRPMPGMLMKGKSGRMQCSVEMGEEKGDSILPVNLVGAFSCHGIDQNQGK
eukprot:754971-Prymnesium_polylepis.1